MTETEASNIGKLILKNAAIEDRLIKFIISNNSNDIKPTDFVILQHMNKRYSIRLISAESKKEKLILLGIVDNRFNYFSIPPASNQASLANYESINSDFLVLDLPFAIDGSSAPYLAAYLKHNSNAALYGKITSDFANGWNKIAHLNSSYSIGTIVDFDISPLANIFMIDNKSSFVVNGYKLERYKSDDWQFAMIGEELIQFKNLEKLENGLYKISHLIRGEMGTENHIGNHLMNEDFVIIYSGVNILPVSINLINKEASFKVHNIEKSIIYKNKAQMPLKPYITKRKKINNQLHIKWETRTKAARDWSFLSASKSDKFKITLIDEDQTYSYTSETNEIIIDISFVPLRDNYQIEII